MEYALLYQVGLVIKGIVWGGYGVVGFYGVKTGVRYVRDYREAISKENG